MGLKEILRLEVVPTKEKKGKVSTPKKTGVFPYFVTSKLAKMRQITRTRSSDIPMHLPGKQPRRKYKRRPRRRPKSKETVEEEPEEKRPEGEATQEGREEMVQGAVGSEGVEQSYLEEERLHIAVENS